MKTATHHWLIRTYPGQKHVSVWLIRRDGDSQGALLWGEMVPNLAEEIVAATGMPVEREGSPLEGMAPVPVPGCVSVAKQGDLFAIGEEIIDKGDVNNV